MNDGIIEKGLGEHFYELNINIAYLSGFIHINVEKLNHPNLPVIIIGGGF